MFTKLWMVLVLTCAVGQAADVPAKPTTPIQAKPELRGILTDDDFAKLQSLAVKYTLVCKLKDQKQMYPIAMEFRATVKKLGADPEGWTDAEFDAKSVSIRRVLAIFTLPGIGQGMHLEAADEFYNATGDFVTDSSDQQEFAKRWTMQSKLLDIVNLDIIRRKETLDFMNNHPLLFPDIPTRIKFIDWLASVNIKTKVLNEIRADLVGEQPDAAKPNQRKQKP